MLKFFEYSQRSSINWNLRNSIIVPLYLNNKITKNYLKINNSIKGCYWDVNFKKFIYVTSSNFKKDLFSDKKIVNNPYILTNKLTFISCSFIKYSELYNFLPPVNKYPKLFLTRYYKFFLLFNNYTKRNLLNNFDNIFFSKKKYIVTNKFRYNITLLNNKGEPWVLNLRDLKRLIFGEFFIEKSRTNIKQITNKPRRSFLRIIRYFFVLMNAFNKFSYFNRTNTTSFFYLKTAYQRLYKKAFFVYHRWLFGRKNVETIKDIRWNAPILNKFQKLMSIMYPYFLSKLQISTMESNFHLNKNLILLNCFYNLFNDFSKIQLIKNYNSETNLLNSNILKKIKNLNSNEKLLWLKFFIFKEQLSFISNKFFLDYFSLKSIYWNILLNKLNNKNKYYYLNEYTSNINFIFKLNKNIINKTFSIEPFFEKIVNKQ